MNQVTTQVKREDTRCPPSPANESGQHEGEGEGARSRVGLALGNTWAHCVNTRLVMEFLTSELRKVRSHHGNHPTIISQGGQGVPYHHGAWCSFIICCKICTPKRTLGVHTGGHWGYTQEDTGGTHRRTLGVHTGGHWGYTQEDIGGTHRTLGVQFDTLATLLCGSNKAMLVKLCKAHQTLTHRHSSVQLETPKSGNVRVCGVHGVRHSLVC